ncbi:aldo/keto reductase [Paractinoplanes brasiliensis]|uniref:Diketogulonate reductase-like aldo/keto reductase n=1 Tax=Paractinoplanes brasiliensis TaxID=52695 RepID=A0A4R6JKS5_9ACTN|nr:aldo/keto reductase [Actinoplanes brasiliensis]TDO36870.1 diketogulonate reductase-like aldo/keto reductase [Actinoplanes brasiliensis]GID30388.1 2,5-diketo-D-gluconic acid reductase [Actinoplanes brasiliensis]
MSHVPTITLNNGVEMPPLGFGVFQIPPADTERAVLEAFEAGYRSIDTAAAYQNEEAVGRAIAASGIPRDELFITTKLWIQDAGDEPAKRALETSLRKLGLDQLDLCLIHAPYGDYYGTWRALEAACHEGSVRAIGVSNFHPDRLTDLIAHNEIVPAVDQVETHPYHQRTADEHAMRKRTVQIQAWGPLAQGQHHLLQDPVLTELARAHDKSTAQIALRWLMQRQVPAVVKSTKPQRVRENLAVFDFELTDADMARIATLDGKTGPAYDNRDADTVDAVNGMKLT